MKPRIRVPSRDYTYWLYGIWHFNKSWDVGIPEYKGCFHHTKQALYRIQNEALSECMGMQTKSFKPL